MAKKITSNENNEGIEDVLKLLNKQFGEGSVMMLGESPK